MTLKEIQELIKLVAKTELSEFRYKDGDVKLHIRGKSYVGSGGGNRQSGAGPSIINVPAAAPAYGPAPAAPAPAAPVAPQAPAAPAAAPKADDESRYVEVKSPMIGTFYRSPSPDKDPYVKVGDMIKKGDTVCIVEAMKLFNEIESEVSGKIVKMLVDDASPIEYDQPLYLVDPA
ncbi:acetyl-CoA carboxylase biotin carboxyl carrier protein [Neolewinella aurantiaca]|uniref:Biotin carboxyl carrier protein of acetyl-CoA carboxylase n=1 Tax=Neolewinella aurantiaca TaxID=2602767 RepID=A0A5C7G054_9BACT|nr:acetyl-CoA carboxylase biotin carboxyl carrier protein [Neolewinella aurantiaca]TXF90996.1 acetyl-CoA carboxylase biotin carboxyl carrier protein [Neolewinella aurantiaca]